MIKAISILCVYAFLVVNCLAQDAAQMPNVRSSKTVISDKSSSLVAERLGRGYIQHTLSGSGSVLSFEADRTAPRCLEYHF